MTSAMETGQPAMRIQVFGGLTYTFLTECMGARSDNRVREVIKADRALFVFEYSIYGLGEMRHKMRTMKV